MTLPKNTNSSRTERRLLEVPGHDPDNVFEPDPVVAVLVVAGLVREEHVLKEGVAGAGHLDGHGALVDLKNMVCLLF